MRSLDYAVKHLSDFEKLLAFWRQRGYSHPIFYQIKKSSVYRGRRGCQCHQQSRHYALFIFHAPDYRTTCHVEVASPEHAEALLSADTCRINRLIRLAGDA